MNDKQQPGSPKPYKRYKSSRFRPLRSKSVRPNQQEYEGIPPVEPGLPEPQGKKPSRRGSRGKRLGTLLLVLLALALIFSVVSFWRLDRAIRASNARVPNDVEQVLAASAGGMLSTPVNILFLGSDQRPGEPARADTLLLMRVDADKKMISQLSIPRDSLADIPGYGEGKINSGYSYGGPALQIEAVELLTGLPVHHYVEMDFDGFPNIVDSLGGVEIDVATDIDSQYPEGVEWTQVHFDAGPQKMDGDRALVYVRVRYSDDDFQRIARQQQFMDALQKKMTSPVNIMKMPIIAPSIINNITTDMSTSDLMTLAWVKFRAPAQNNRKFTLVGYDENIAGASYVVLDDEANQEIVRDFLGN